MNQYLITIFTPTYNRAHTLHLGYEALLRQSSKDFVWLIVDDGSTDGTKELVAKWVAENKIPIRYHYQENRGIHGAFNTAVQLIDTELFINVDSDDQLTDDAVRQILTFWKAYGNHSYAGMIGLTQNFKNKRIGTKLPNQKSTTLIHFYYQHKGTGDKALIYQTKIVKQYDLFPYFDNEKFVPLSYLYHQIDQDYDLLILNTPLVSKEYHSDGLSTHIYQQYWNNPKGYAFYRRYEMNITPTITRKFKVCIHYIASCIRAKDKQWLKKSPSKIMTLLAFPMGILLYTFIRHKVKKNQKFTVKY